MPVSPLQAQRLWLLMRPPAAGRGAAVRTDFAGAIAVLAERCVCVLVIVSDDPERASEQALWTRAERFNLERDAFTFATLDEALLAVDEIRREFLARGWRESMDRTCGNGNDIQEETR